MAETNECTSNLLTISEQFRTKNLICNSGLYVCACRYGEGHPNTLSDGDDKGRNPVDPHDLTATIGTKTDITERTDNKLCNGKYNCCRGYYGEGNC